MGNDLKECPLKEVEVVWVCDAEKGALCGKEGDWNESTMEEG